MGGSVVLRSVPKGASGGSEPGQLRRIEQVAAPGIGEGRSGDEVDPPLPLAEQGEVVVEPLHDGQPGAGLSRKLLGA